MSDGRIVWDEDGWGVFRTREDAFDRCGGGEEDGIADLLALLPPADH